MKRLFVLIIAVIALVPVMAFATGTVTQTLAVSPKTNVSVLTFSFTGDASNGTVPSTATSTEITNAIDGMCIYHVITNPGSTAPTTLYDIVLNDADGIDMMGGTMADRSATASELAIPLLSSTYGTTGCRMVNGSITLVITNQNVNSATGDVKVILKRP